MMRWFHGPWWRWPWPYWFFYQRRLWLAFSHLPAERREAYMDALQRMKTAGKVTMAEAVEGLYEAVKQGKLRPNQPASEEA